MIKYIINALNIGDLPKWLLTHFFLMAVFLGGLNALIFVTAFSEFLACHDLTYYPEIIAASGIIGILFFNLYKYMFKKYLPKKTILIFYSIFILVVLVYELLPRIIPAFPHAFFLLAFTLPVTIISEQIFFKISENVPVAKEFYNLRRFLEFGMASGSVLFSVVLIFLSAFHVAVPFTVLALVCLLFVVVDYSLISRRLEYNEDVKDDESVDSLISFISEVPLKKTVFFVILFASLSILTFVFVEYTFLSALDKVFADPAHVVQFIAFFWASSMVVNLLFKLFVYQNLIKTFRVSRALQLSPFFMVIILLGINVLLLMPQFNDMTTPFSLAFLSIVFCRFFSFLLRESFEFFSLKLFFSALETYTKRHVSNLLTQLLNFWSFIFAGLLLLLFNSFEIRSMSGILVVSVGFTFLWMIVSMELSRNYRQTLASIIKKLTREFKIDDQEKLKNLKDRIMVTTNLSGMRYLLNYQRSYQPNNFQKTIGIISDNLQNKLGVNDDKASALDVKLSMDYDSDYTPVMPLSFYDSDENLKIEDVELLAVSVKIKDRINAAKLIENAHDPKYYGILKMLLRDPDDEVKRNAIGAVSTNFNNSLIVELLEYIDHEEFADLVADSLVSIGNDAVEPLISLFQKSDLSVKTLSRVIRIIGRISSERAQNFLFGKLNYPNKWIVLEVVNALNEEKFKFTFGDYTLIDHAIFSTCGAAAWLLAMDVSLGHFNRQVPVKRALDEEYHVTIDLLFKLLQLKYSDGVIQEARRHLLGNSANEQKELSVELLGSLVDKEMKDYLFPLLHNNRKKEKVRQLQSYFPVELKDSMTALREIINTDLGHVSLWTKACALKSYIELQDDVISDDVYAQVFNPDPLLSEIAFFGIYKSKNLFPTELFERLSNRMKKRMTSILNKGEHYEYQMLFNKVVSLQNISYFENVKGHYLLPLAEILIEHYLNQGESLYIQCSDEEVLPVFMVPLGDVALKDMHKRQFRINRNFLYGLGLYAGGITLNAFTSSVVYIAKPEQIGSLVLNHEELSETLHKYIQNSNFY